MPEPVTTTTARRDAASPALSIRDLGVTFSGRSGDVRAVDGVSLDVMPGEVVCIVGESGSGKSATGLACLGLSPDSATVTGQVIVDGHDMVALPEREREGVRGKSIAMVFQDALAALNPYRTVGRQIADAYRLRHDVSASAAHARAVEVLDLVGLTDPQRQADMYPHEFSGGMRQRAMIAMAVVNEPDVLIADEPTTALDVTVQDQVLDLLVGLVDRLGMALVLVTHDLGVVAQVADRVAVMYAGRLVETGDVLDVFEQPTHPYTVGLQASMPERALSVGGRRGHLPTLPGSPASGVDRPSGCAFHTRCTLRELIGDRCVVEVPELRERRDSLRAACHAEVAQVDSWRHRGLDEPANPVEDEPLPTTTQEDADA